MSFPTGRFAPSPTGRLHLGSLVAATGSLLDARARGGRWLLRMEDLDTPRNVPGAADEILRTLEAFGFAWDGPVVYQSRRAELYAEALERLRTRGRLFECSCSRRDVASALVGTEGGYPGTCRGGPQRPGRTALRFRVPDRSVAFVDRFQGRQCFDLRRLGDVVVRRRDGIIAYHLAVVVDDADQGVRSVVRGADLLASTPWQLALQEALGLPRPEYGHLPLVTEPGGAKLAKSRRSIPLDPHAAPALLMLALRLLRQEPPPALERARIAAIWDWALGHWAPERLAGIAEAALPC